MSFWGGQAHALALIELLHTGETHRRRLQEQAYVALAELGWARRTRRSDVLSLDPAAVPAIEATLARAWPEWRDLLARLVDEGLPATPGGVRELERRRRVDAVDETALPERLNRRTAAAIVGRHAKVRLGPFESVVFEDVDLTDDGLVRMRPSGGLRVASPRADVDARDLASFLGELVLTDRALRDGTRLRGRPPRAVLTVENLGAFQDLAAPDDVLVVHVPGWNTRTTKALLADLEEVPVFHFGDLDPNGVAIVDHLRKWRPGVRWLVPPFWEEYLNTKGLSRNWPEGEMPADAPPWVRELPSRGRWLEQEPVAVDPRFAVALEFALTCFAALGEDR